MGFNSAYDKWGVSDKGKYRNSTNVTAFEAGGVDFITYNDLNYPTVLFSCNGDVESFVADNTYPDGIWSIFAQKDNTYNCYARLYENSYSAKNGTLLGEFIPVVDALGRPCMYDLVSKQAFKNAGTGQFIVGMTLAQVRGLRLPTGGGELTLSLPHEASIDKLAQAALERARANGWTLTLQYAEADVPAGYRRLEFLESTGTQYIDTGVKLSSESEVRCEYLINQNETVNAIFGARDDYSLNAYCTYSPNSSGRIMLLYGENGISSGLDYPSVNEKYVSTVRDGILTVNSKSTNQIKSEAFVSAYSCFLFAVNTKGSHGANPKLQGRIYSFSISRAGEMQVDYVPCISPEGALGMYNRVDGTVKENAGSGAFIAGLATVDDVRTLWLPETSGELTVSVPADTPDSAVEQLRKNNPNWQIAIQYRTENNEN